MTNVGLRRGDLLGPGPDDRCVALADDALQDRLILLQDRIENMMRARYGLPDRDAGQPA